jgi:hypothetical protein
VSRPKQLSPTEAFEAIQALLKECGERLGKTTHARDRMLERTVNDDDILNVLRNGTVSTPEWNEEHQNWKYPVSGMDLDGIPLVIVIALEPQYCRITVITVKDRSR